MLILRSLLFNIIFFGWTAIVCCLLTLTLPFPRRVLIEAIRLYLRSLAWLERTILGLHYQTIGLEHLPQQGSYLIAAKHQSMWETMKLHLILHDPAIVLKHELLYIPLWGWHAAKADQIPVRRGHKGQAISSLLEGARRMKAMGREIVIFPQGTRLAPGLYRPYKIGIAALYESLDLPIVPLALNSGVFWGRRAFTKRPGLITMEFLSPIPPGLPRAVMMTRLENELEAASDRLVRAVGGPQTPYPSAQAAQVDAVGGSLHG
jgi:1-acyl-sn-glycerol-3-phosphate acyltransferase